MEKENPPGWYQHPKTENKELWWDGAKWTETYRYKLFKEYSNT